MKGLAVIKYSDRAEAERAAETARMMAVSVSQGRPRRSNAGRRGQRSDRTPPEPEPEPEPEPAPAAQTPSVEITDHEVEEYMQRVAEKKPQALVILLWVRLAMYAPPLRLCVNAFGCATNDGCSRCVVQDRHHDLPVQPRV